MSDVTDAELTAAIVAVVKDMGLENVDIQAEKVLQMHLACTQRIGVIVVGPSGSGKTTLWRILEGAYKKVRFPTVTRSSSCKLKWVKTTLVRA